MFQRRREETTQKYFRGLSVTNILADLLLVLGTGAITIVMQNFPGWFPQTAAEKLKYFMNAEKNLYEMCFALCKESRDAQLIERAQDTFCDLTEEDTNYHKKCL